MSFGIGGLQKSSLLDYPGKISAIVFTQGCNFCCGYCHNPELISIRQSEISVSDCLDFLKTRKGKLDAVVITGGEPCMQTGLKDFIRQIRELGFLVKLDTNGSFPDVLQEFLDENLLDYIAMDIKAPLEKYTKITNTPVDADKIYQSIQLIIDSGIDYEFRTTVVKSQLAIDDFEKIGELIGGAKKYYLQKFEPSKTLDKKMMSEKTYTEQEFNTIIQTFKQHKSLEMVALRS